MVKANKRGAAATRDVGLGLREFIATKLGSNATLLAVYNSGARAPYGALVAYECTYEGKRSFRLHCLYLNQTTNEWRFGHLLMWPITQRDELLITLPENLIEHRRKLAAQTHDTAA